VLLSCGGLKDLCNDVTERGAGGPELRDHCDEILSSLTAERLYCGHNDVCGDMVDHGNDIITPSTPCGGVSP